MSLTACMSFISILCTKNAVRHSLFFLYAIIFPSQFEPFSRLPRNTLLWKIFEAIQKNSEHVFYQNKNTRLCFIFLNSVFKLVNYLCRSYPTRASYSGQVDEFISPMKNELKTKRFQTRLICILIKQQKHVAINNFI